MNRHIHPHPEDEALSKRMQNLADRVRVNPYFMNELEHKLTEAHRPQKPSSQPWKLPVTALGWIALATLLFFGWAWLRAPQSPLQPAAPPIATGFICPITQPNGNTPPNETTSAGYFGNGKLWTALWPNGIVTMTADNRAADGSLRMKWPFWRGVAGKLEITGRQLDGTNGPVRADIPDGYGETGFQATDLIFPAEGCWEVRAYIGDETLTFVTKVVYDDSTRYVDDLATATFAVQPEYPWRGTKLILKAALSTQPARAEVFEFTQTATTTLNGFHQFVGDGLVTETTPSNYPSLGTFMIISPADALQKILIEGRPVGMLEMTYGPQGGGGRGFFKLNLKGPVVSMPTPIPAPQYLDGYLQYTVVVGDSLQSVARRYGVTPDTIVELNNLPENILKPGTTIMIPVTAPENPPVAVIESITLGYFMRDPNSSRWNPLEDAVLQPVWIFKGTYSDGNSFEIIIQALQETYLRPAIATFESPG